MRSRWPAPADRVIDLDGALVIPGFVDAHVHTTDAGLALAGLDLSGARSLAECLAAMRGIRRGPSRTECCGGTVGRRPGGRRTGRRPASEVDDAVGNRPVYLSRVDVHSALVSTALAASVAGRCGDWPAGRPPDRSPSRPMPQSEPLPDNNSRPASGVSGATRLPAGGGRQRDRRGARVRGRRRIGSGRSGGVAGAGRSDQGARLPRRSGQRPGAG